MKTIIFLILAAVSGFTFAQENEGVTVTVTIPNLRNNEGSASISLFNEATFMKAAPLQNKSATPENKSVTITFENVQPGEYGIITLHDLNDNKQMDFEPSGMPKEDYGISGTGAGFGPPTWADAKITITDQDVNLEIRM